MLCQYCKKEIDEKANFCNFCGQPVNVACKQPQVDGNVNIENIEKKAVDSKFKLSIVVISIFCVALVIISVIFLYRKNNESALYNNIADFVYNATEGDIINFYDDVLSETYDRGGYTIGITADDFNITKTSDKNIFSVTGEVEITDLSQEDVKPTYSTLITTTLTTNFFRSEGTWKFDYTFETPSDSNSMSNLDSSVITLEELNNAYNSNQLAADNKYANQYLNVYGKVSEISSVKSDGTVDVELEYYSINPDATFELFFGVFTFNSSNMDLYSLQTDEYVTLTGYLTPGGGSTYIYFTNASLFKSNNNDDNVKDVSGTNEPNIPTDDLDIINDLSLIEGTWHQAHDYSTTLTVWFDSDMSGINGRNFWGSEPACLHFELSGYGFYEEGEAYWFPSPNVNPSFDGEFYYVGGNITISVDDFNQLFVDCPDRDDLNLHNAQFFDREAFYWLTD